MKLDEVLLQDVRASQPAANAVPAGTLFFVTDEKVTEQSDGAAWSSYSGPYPIDLTTDVTGDLPLSNLAQGTALSVLGVAGNATADNASIVAASDHQVMRRSGTGVGFGQVDLSSSAAVVNVLPVANGGTGVSSGFTSLLTATVTLTDAQIKALPTTMITLVAAPGAGSWNKIIGITSILRTGAGAYTNINAADAWVAITNGSGAWLATAIVNDNTLSTPLAQLSGFLGAADEKVIPMVAPIVTPIDAGSTDGDEEYLVVTSAAGSQSPTALGNTALMLEGWNNGAGDFTGGNAGNTWKFIIYYIVEAL
jgi:hypothetical protein